MIKRETEPGYFEIDSTEDERKRLYAVDRAFVRETLENIKSPEVRKQLGKAFESLIGPQSSD